MRDVHRRCNRDVLGHDRRCRLMNRAHGDAVRGRVEFMAGRGGLRVVGLLRKDICFIRQRDRHRERVVRM